MFVGRKLDVLDTGIIRPKQEPFDFQTRAKCNHGTFTSEKTNTITNPPMSGTWSGERQ